MTALGPLCGEHVVMCTQPDEAREANQSRGREKVPNVQKAAQDTQRVVRSPEEGVLLPRMADSLRKDRQGLFAVVAVRTFRDANVRAKPAGSVWLSSDEASKSNERGGDMKIFNLHKDIFENIEQAKSWIENQVQEMSEEDMHEEAMKRWEQAQQKAKSKSTCLLYTSDAADE